MKLHASGADWREFHISRQTREKYQFDEWLFSTNGNVVFSNFAAARLFAHKMNAQRDLVRHPEQTVHAAQIYAMGLLDEILHHIVARYRKEKNPRLLDQTIARLEAQLGAADVDEVLLRFTEQFPPLAVHRGQMNAATYLTRSTEGTPNRQIALEELLMLWVSNRNPAMKPFSELFDDSALSEETSYRLLIGEVQTFFATQPGFGPGNNSVLEMLLAPAMAAPDSLQAQLDFVLGNWSYLSEGFFTRLLTGIDFIKEENKPFFPGPGPAHIPVYTGDGETVGMDEPERFSEDREWMPRAVVMAKNAYVWRDQLSKKYGREIRTLDQFPDEELDSLARAGFTGLWLIGLWERSVASQTIKQMCGNPDAVASAYSLHDYEIAHNLGGPDAMHNLRDRAWQRGIRMASDMVPNHMAIDSRWVVEHPEWFITLDEPPFPTYTFNGPDLSHDPRVGIYLEDHYYSKSDAAVVFKRVDRWTGETKYVYHGNDGTTMPWNDTAQLNYLNPEVREGVIQTILHVARQFPIIRFDAAMTLAKRHYQRLWFPEPGTGGAIASRAEHGLTARKFNEAFPEEFWRDVVDRVALELPDTLLLAEAFWMMEGYFVRTLGMHRVYNSAFMNMLRDEENAQYRLVIRNTLEFDPDILRRYVNFLNNPDEDTAVEQFGKGDKYFGLCTMMATLPGLPMFGHGQIEGFAEKYGMEYQRAYWDETPDAYLVARHEREIFPLLKRRYLFADAADFAMYDFWTAGGTVNEDVFAYSNKHGDERGLVIYHNKFAEAAGWIRSSVGTAYKKANGEKDIVQRSLAEALGIETGKDRFVIFRDNVSDLEYIRDSTELCERGLYVELKAYETHVFLDFRQVVDTLGQYARVAANLNGQGTPRIEIALRELELEPVLTPFRELVNADILRRLTEPHQAESVASATKTNTQDDSVLLQEVESKSTVLLKSIHDFQTGQVSVSVLSANDIPQKISRSIKSALTLFKEVEGDAENYLAANFDDATRATLVSWLLVRNLGDVDSGETTEKEGHAQSRAWLDELLFGYALSQALREFGLEPYQADSGVDVIKALTSCGDSLGIKNESELLALLTTLLQNPDAQRILGVNRYEGVVYFNQQGLGKMLWWILAVNALELTGAKASEQTGQLKELQKAMLQLQTQATTSGFQVEKFLQLSTGITSKPAKK